jgi:prophage antirepressor-like protein
MSNKLIDFNYRNHQIRSILDNQGNPWFVAKDVFAALDISWKRSDSLKSIPESWKKGAGDNGPLCDQKGVGKLPTPGGEQKLIFISEPAVYMIAFRSNKPEAIDFTEWVAGEVLPSIRKTGKYVLPSEDIPKFKGGLTHLPTMLKKAESKEPFAIFCLVELGIHPDKPIPSWIKDELILKTKDEIAELASNGSNLAHHFIKSLFGFDIQNPQISF